eukprot:gene8724-10506_t
MFDEDDWGDEWGGQRSRPRPPNPCKPSEPLTRMWQYYPPISKASSAAQRALELESLEARMRIHKESNSTFTLPRVSRWNTLQAFSGGAGFRTPIPNCSRKDAKHAVKRMATFIEDLATLRHNLKTIFDSWDEMPIEVIESVASSDLGNMHTQLMISYHTEESARAETEALLATGMALEEVALLARILSGLPFSPTEAYGLRQTFVNSGDTDGDWFEPSLGHADVNPDPDGLPEPTSTVPSRKPVSAWGTSSKGGGGGRIYDSPSTFSAAETGAAVRNYSPTGAVYAPTVIAAAQKPCYGGLQEILTSGCLGSIFPICKPRITLGRLEQCDIRINREPVANKDVQVDANVETGV